MMTSNFGLYKKHVKISQTLIYLITCKESRKGTKSFIGSGNQVEFLTIREGLPCQKHRPAGIIKYDLKDTLY